MRVLALFGLIGTALGLPQTCLAQASGGAEIPVGAREFREPLQALLGRRRDLQPGWRLAANLGAPAQAMLWDLFATAPRGRKLPFLVAAGQGAGNDRVERLLQVIESAGQAAFDERMVGLCLLAFGPESPAVQGEFWARITRKLRDKPVALLVAGYAAAARVPNGMANAPPPGSDDPGLLAAALLAGYRGSEAAVAEAFRGATAVAHAELICRGYLLGRLRTMDDGDLAADTLLQQRARAALHWSGPQLAAVRECAALVLGCAGVRPELDAPDWQLLQLLAATPQGARLQLAELGPLPKALVESPGRLLAEYALYTPMARVLQDLPTISQSPEARSVIALALAWRLLARPEPDRLLAAPMADTPEWFWVQWACGETPAMPMGSDGRPLGQCDPGLERALPLARERRLPRPVAQQLLEQALWGQGWHPGLGLYWARIALVRDVLITGSYAGTKYQANVPPERRYLPQGVQRDAPMFDVLVELVDYLSQPRLPVPRECRLP